MNRGTCRSCGAPILWAQTENHKPIPLDATPVRGFFVEPDPDGRHADLARVVSFYQSHFATCPNAAAHRKERTL